MQQAIAFTNLHRCSQHQVVISVQVQPMSDCFDGLRAKSNCSLLIRQRHCFSNLCTGLFNTYACTEWPRLNSDWQATEGSLPGLHWAQHLAERHVSGCFSGQLTAPAAEVPRYTAIMLALLFICLWLNARGLPVHSIEGDSQPLRTGQGRAGQGRAAAMARACAFVFVVDDSVCIWMQGQEANPT